MKIVSVTNFTTQTDDTRKRKENPPPLAERRGTLGPLNDGRLPGGDRVGGGDGVPRGVGQAGGHARLLALLLGHLVVARVEVFLLLET